MVQIGHLYVVGGHSFKSREALSTFWIWNDDDRRWIRGPSCHRPRQNASLIALSNGSLLLMGGESEETQRDHSLYLPYERYDPITNQWSLLPILDIQQSHQDMVYCPSTDIILLADNIGWSMMWKHPSSTPPSPITISTTSSSNITSQSDMKNRGPNHSGSKGMKVWQNIKTLDTPLGSTFDFSSTCHEQHVIVCGGIRSIDSQHQSSCWQRSIHQLFPTTSSAAPAQAATATATTATTTAPIKRGKEMNGEAMMASPSSITTIDGWQELPSYPIGISNGSLISI
jgi:hypothetical protein